jgi:hypothetical protein
MLALPESSISSPLSSLSADCKQALVLGQTLIIQRGI